MKYIWTSGRLCDFKGCNRPDLLPNEINGWFWTAELQKLPPTTNRQQNDWSEGGGIGKPQPDNRVRNNIRKITLAMQITMHYYLIDLDLVSTAQIKRSKIRILMQYLFNISGVTYVPTYIICRELSFMQIKLNRILLQQCQRPTLVLTFTSFFWSLIFLDTHKEL